MNTRQIRFKIGLVATLLILVASSSCVVKAFDFGLQTFGVPKRGVNSAILLQKEAMKALWKTKICDAPWKEKAAFANDVLNLALSDASYWADQYKRELVLIAVSGVAGECFVNILFWLFCAKKVKKERKSRQRRTFVAFLAHCCEFFVKKPARLVFGTYGDCSSYGKVVARLTGRTIGTAGACYCLVKYGLD